MSATVVVDYRQYFVAMTAYNQSRDKARTVDDLIYPIYVMSQDKVRQLLWPVVAPHLKSA